MRMQSRLAQYNARSVYLHFNRIPKSSQGVINSWNDGVGNTMVCTRKHLANRIRMDMARIRRLRRFHTMLQFHIPDISVFACCAVLQHQIEDRVARQCEMYGCRWFKRYSLCCWYMWIYLRVRYEQMWLEAEGPDRSDETAPGASNAAT